MDRVIAYIDGFNLYFGLRDKGWRRYLWLDVQKLSTNLLKPGQQLVFTKYFTAVPPSARDGLDSLAAPRLRGRFPHRALRSEVRGSCVEVNTHPCRGDADDPAVAASHV